MLCILCLVCTASGENFDELDELNVICQHFTYSNPVKIFDSVADKNFHCHIMYGINMVRTSEVLSSCDKEA